MKKKNIQLPKLLPPRCESRVSGVGVPKYIKAAALASSGIKPVIAPVWIHFRVLFWLEKAISLQPAVLPLYQTTHLEQWLLSPQKCSPPTWLVLLGRLERIVCQCLSLTYSCLHCFSFYTLYVSCGLRWNFHQKNLHNYSCLLHYTCWRR